MTVESILLDRDGLEVEIPSGTAIDLRLPFENEGDSPCAFAGRIDGSGAASAQLERESVPVAGHGKGTMVARFVAPAAGRYELQIAVYEEGYLVEPPGWRGVTLVVAAPAEAPFEPEPVVEKAVEAVPTLAPPKTRVVVEMPPTPPVGEPEPTVVTFKREAKPEPVAPIAVPAPPAPTPSAPAKARVVVDMGAATPPETEKRGDTVRTTIDETAYSHVVQNPSDGAVIELAPGEGALVALDFENKGADKATYVLEVRDDRSPTEGFGYAKPLVHDVNMGPGKKDRFLFEINVPSGASPGSHPMRVLQGRYGGKMETIRLELKITPRIAVRLDAEKPKAVVGPLNRVPEFVLQVTNAGNVDTAYRLTAKGAAPDGQAEPGEYPEMPERDGWSYLFDKEAENLRLGSASGGTAKEPARLRLFREGVWWAGWWQTQRVKAVAVPVTDPRNAKEAGNAVDLVGTRWRLLPFPWFVSLPLGLLVFALFLGGFGVSDLRVENAVRSDEGILFVLQPHDAGYKADPAKPAVPIAAKLAWSAPALSLLKVVTHREGAEQSRVGLGRATVVQPVEKYEESDSFRVTSILGLGGQDTPRVVYLPLRTTNAFSFDARYSVENGAPQDLAVADESTETPDPHTMSVVGSNVPEKLRGTTLDTWKICLTLGPTDRLYITPQNSGKDNDVQVWRLINPKDYTVGSLNEGAATPIYANNVGGKTWQILPKPGIRPTGTDDFWFVTTDSGMSVVHLVIRRVAGVDR